MKKKIIIVVFSIIVFTLFLIYFSDMLNDKRVSRELSTLQASAYVLNDVEVYQLDEIPELSKNYILYSLNKKVSIQRMAQLSYTKKLTYKNNIDNYEGKTYLGIYKPCILSIEEKSIFPFLWKNNREFYIEGYGDILTKFMSIITTNSKRGDEANMICFVKYILSTPYVPFILYNKSLVSYISGDSNHIVVTFKDNDFIVNCKISFDNNKITEISYIDNNKNNSSITFLAKYNNYKEINGAIIPTVTSIEIYQDNELLEHYITEIENYRFY
jgi:hypothetical protein